jgi:hypothetical protein
VRIRLGRRCRVRWNEFSQSPRQSSSDRLAAWAVKRSALPYGMRIRSKKTLQEPRPLIRPFLGGCFPVAVVGKRNSGFRDRPMKIPVSREQVPRETRGGFICATTASRSQFRGAHLALFGTRNRRIHPNLPEAMIPLKALRGSPDQSQKYLYGCGPESTSLPKPSRSSNPKSQLLA